jgi:GT2 family glycosyltransferase
VTDQWPETAVGVVDDNVPAVSVVIVSWNTCDCLRRCLESIDAHDRLAQMEIIVIDNASDDGSAAMVAKRFPTVKLLINDKNRGFARACNQGMAAASAEFILLLNSDTYVVDDTISRMAAHLAGRPEMALASCERRLPDGRPQQSAFRALSIFRSLVEDLWLYKLVPRRRRPDFLLGAYWDGAEEKEVDWVAGAFVMLRRAVFEASGGFNEAFFMYGEDCEWCMRLRRMGFNVFFVPLGPVYHVGAASSRLVWTERQRLRRAHLGGVQAYASLHGSVPALMYAMTRLLGASVRWSAYTAAGAVSRSDYYRDQRRQYGWIAAFHLDAVLHWRSLTRPITGAMKSTTQEAHGRGADGTV